MLQGAPRRKRVGRPRHDMGRQAAAISGRDDSGYPRRSRQARAPEKSARRRDVSQRPRRFLRRSPEAGKNRFGRQRRAARHGNGERLENCGRSEQDSRRLLADALVRSGLRTQGTRKGARVFRRHAAAFAPHGRSHAPRARIQDGRPVRPLGAGRVSGHKPQPMARHIESDL